MKIKLLFPVFGLMVAFNACTPTAEPRVSANLEHSLHLLDSTMIDGLDLKWIAIYADAPSYDHIIAAGEGVTCVDDVGRYLEVLEHEILVNQRLELLPIAEGMVNYLLYLSRDDGLWYNFMYADGEINKTYQTSVASFGWWAVRGLRGLGAGIRIFDNNSTYADLWLASVNRFQKAQPHLDSLFAIFPNTVETSDQKQRPAWNMGSAPDQSAELLLALEGVHGIADFNYADEIAYLAEALMGWQYVGDNEDFKGTYFCWQTLWHGWGNTQALALVRAYELLDDEAYLESVKLWADHFVPTLINMNFPAAVELDSTGVWSTTMYSQIAYGIGSTYRGMEALARVTGDKTYQDRSEAIFDWFKGQNIAQTMMYNPENGRCFDGINGPDQVNLNSGAESTIECLLAIQSRGGW